MFPCSHLQAFQMASAVRGGVGGAVPWENPVDEPFSSGKDASSQQLCPTYCARVLGVLILSVYGKLLIILKPGRFLHYSF